MPKWAERSDSSVFGDASESKDSQDAYERDVEIRRRLHLLQKQSLGAQIEATAAQREAIRAQKDAIAEMRRQSTLMFWSVLGIAATAFFTLVAAVSTLVAAFIK